MTPLLILGLALVAASAVLVLRSFVGEPFRIPGGMCPPSC